MNEILTLLDLITTCLNEEEQKLALSKLFLTINELEAKLIEFDENNFQNICISAFDLVYIFFGVEDYTETGNNNKAFIRLFEGVIEILKKFDIKLCSYIKGRLITDYHRRINLITTQYVGNGLRAV